MTRIMKNMSAVILALAIIVGFMPVVTAGGNASAETQYWIWVSGIQVTDSNKNDIDGTGTASYDPENNVLTLEDYNYSGAGIMVNNAGFKVRGSIVAWGPLTIKSKGSVVINTADTSGDETADIIGGIVAINHSGGAGELYFENGNVTSKASSASPSAEVYGVYAERSIDLYKMTLNATAKNTKPVALTAGIGFGDSSSDAGIYMVGSTINAKGGTGEGSDPNSLSSGINGYGTIDFDNNSTVNLSTGKSGTTAGISGDADVVIGNAKVTITPGEKLANYGVQVGITASSVLLTSSDAKLKVAAEHAFMGCSPEVSGGTVYARYSSNIDGTVPESGGVYCNGETPYGSSAMMEEAGQSSYFETSVTSFKSINSCDIQLEGTKFIYTGGQIRPAVTVKDGNKVLTEGVDYSVNYHNNKEVGYAKVLVTGLGARTGQEELGFEIVARGSSVRRIAGLTRYDTAKLSAAELLGIRGEGDFNNIIVASGSNFPDALAGSYLAKVKKAPILLVTDSVESTITDYITDHLNTGGTVYILGGTGVVSQKFENGIMNANIKTKRLAGASRYETNIKILKAAGVSDEEILVCSGNGYADSLSASATGKPILLVGDTLTADQKTYLKTLDSTAICAIGGTGVVSNSIFNQVAKAIGGDVAQSRAAGADRYKTSVEVARRFFKRADCVTLAYAQNFPDGLSGGPLALEVGAPLLLVTNDSYKDAVKFCEDYSNNKVYVFGGASLIRDEVALKMIPPKG